jgi:NADP-dependent 3-hydroxy acid dehydrogenase YdfG
VLEAKAVQVSQTALLFLNEGGVGRDVKAAFADRGFEVTTLRRCDRFAQFGPRDYGVRPGDVGDLRAVLAAAGRPFATIIHMWSADRQDDFDEAQHSGFYSVAALVRALGLAAVTTSLDLWIVTTGVQSVTGGEPLHPPNATLAGACPVITQENPNIAARLLDIDASASAEAMLAIMTAPKPASVTAIRAGAGWVQTFERAMLPSATGSSGWRDGVYLISGGAGEIGLALAEHLGVRGARLILTARGLTDERRTRIRELRARGIAIEIIEADVADEAAMRQGLVPIRALFGPIDGVIHAAGITRGEYFKPLDTIGRAECDAHFRGKAKGLVVLERLLADEAKQGFLLFSSMSAVLGGLGLSAYAAANAYLDACAHRRNQMAGPRWLSVNWDTWRLRENPHGDFGATLENYAMSAAEGLAAVDRVLSVMGAVPQLVNSTGDLDIRLQQWVTGLALTEEPDEGPTVHARPALATPFVEMESDTERAVAAVWERTLGMMVGAQDNFFDLGGNSLVGTQLIGRLRKRFGLALPLSLLFEAPTVSGMALAVEAAILDEIEAMDDANASRLAAL